MSKGQWNTRQNSRELIGERENQCMYADRLEGISIKNDVSVYREYFADRGNI